MTKSISMIKITQTKSVIGSNYKKKRTMKALGIRKMHHSVTHKESPEILGMVNRVRELVKVEKV